MTLPGIGRSSQCPAVVLIQSGYWLGLRLRLSPPRSGHIFIGPVAGFVARLSFILARSAFALMFLVRFDQLSLPPHRIAMLLALLFSMFCYSLELERLGKALRNE